MRSRFRPSVKDAQVWGQPTCDHQLVVSLRNAFWTLANWPGSGSRADQSDATALNKLAEMGGLVANGWIGALVI